MIYRGTSGNLLYDMQLDMHAKHFPGWKAELSLYNAIMARGFAADGKTLKMDFAKWDPRQRRLMVDLTLQMAGGSSGYLGTATSKNLQTAAQNVQGKVVAYDFAGIAHAFQYDTVLSKLAAGADGAERSYVRDMLVQEMETFKNNANLINCFGYDATLIASGASYASGSQLITIDPGISVQNLYIGQLVQDTTAVSTSLSSGAPVANYHGLISAITKNDQGGYNISYTHYDGSTGCQFTSSATSVHLHGQYQVSPYGLRDFVTANNTVGDLARSTYTAYNPTVYAASQVTGFQDDPCYGLMAVSAEVKRNCNNSQKPNLVLMSEITAMWMQKKYASRLKFDQGLKAPSDSKKAFGYDPIFQVSPTMTAFVCDNIPDGEMWGFAAENVGVTQLPGENGPNYIDLLAGGEKGIRIHGTLTNETGLVWYYQMYARHLAGFFRIHSIALT